MSNQRAVNFSLIAFAALLVFIAYKLVDQLWVYLELQDSNLLGVVTIPGIIGAVIGIGVTAVLRRHPVPNTFLVEAAEEIRQITWPTKQEVMDSTRMVIIATIFLAVVLGVFDLVWAKIAKLILQ